MPRPKSTQPVEENDEPIVPTPDETEEIEETEEVSEKEGPAIDILIAKDPNVTNYESMIFVRQYSRKAHGSDYKELAAEFCTKRPTGGRGIYIQVPSNKIGNVEVRFREKLDYDTHIDKQDPNAPIVDKVKVFENKEEAVRFGSIKNQSTVVVSRVKKAKK
jgi:hypothetical protein